MLLDNSEQHNSSDESKKVYKWIEEHTDSGKMDIVTGYFTVGALRGNTFRCKKVFLVNLPIPKIPKSQQLPFEILVDCILFAKENNLEIEAETFESVIDGMVYDLYFEDEMKKANCFITNRIAETVKPFKADDSDNFKMEYIKKLYKFCRNDKIIFRGIIHRRNIKVVKIINGEKKRVMLKK